MLIAQKTGKPEISLCGLRNCSTNYHSEVVEAFAFVVAVVVVAVAFVSLIYFYKLLPANSF